MPRLLFGFLTAPLTMALLFAAQPSEAGDDWSGTNIKHVLLISIDGMHAVDFINCAKGINGGAPYCPNLAKLAKTGVSYRDTSSSKPSDSFPGLTAIVSGGGPRTEGAFYDVAYDRSLNPPTITTGNGVAGTGPGGCTSGAAPTGTTTEFDEGIDLDQTQLNGAPAGVDGGIRSIDPLKLERDPANNCAAGLQLGLRAHEHHFWCHPCGRRLRRVVGQTSFLFLGFRAWHWWKGGGRLLLPGN